MLFGKNDFDFKMECQTTIKCMIEYKIKLETSITTTGFIIYATVYYNAEKERESEREAEGLKQHVAFNNNNNY